MNVPTMRAALYTRVSTRDKGQDTANQLDQLRDLCRSRSWEIARRGPARPPSPWFTFANEWVSAPASSSSANRGARRRIVRLRPRMKFYIGEAPELSATAPA